MGSVLAIFYEEEPVGGRGISDFSALIFFLTAKNYSSAEDARLDRRGAVIGWAQVS